LATLLEFDVESDENFAKFGNQTSPKTPFFAFLKKKNHQQKKIASNHPRDISGHLQIIFSFFI
jgi:hypothetical protein